MVEGWSTVGVHPAEEGMSYGLLWTGSVTTVGARGFHRVQGSAPSRPWLRPFVLRPCVVSVLCVWGVLSYFLFGDGWF